MRYATQKIAYTYFVGAMALFLTQVLFGVLSGLVYVWPNFLAVAAPFNILRMIHINALIVWLLLGFFGAAAGGRGRSADPRAGSANSDRPMSGVSA